MYNTNEITSGIEYTRREVKQDCFKDLSKLEFVSFACLQTLSGSIFHELPNLLDVSLSYSTLKEIPVELFRNSTKLTHLDLENNRNLKAIQVGTFHGLKHLTNLNLSGNRLETLDKSLFSALI